MNRIIALLAALAALTLASCGGGAQEMRIVSASSTVVVSPHAPNGWAGQISGTSTTSWVNGPSGNPCGDDSYQLTTGADGNGAAQARYTGANGVLLSDITELTYSTYISSHPGNTGQAPYIILTVDFQDGGSTQDDLLFFEPEYSNGDYDADGDTTTPFNLPDVTVGEWQTWNAIDGAWYSVFGNGGSGPGANAVSWGTYTALFPTATIRVSTLGNLRILAGFGAPTWDNFVGSIDCVKLGVGDDTTTFDFEISTAEDCKNGGWQNLGYKNQGECVSAHKNKGQQGEYRGGGPQD